MFGIAKKNILFTTAIFMAITAMAQTKKATTDYLSVPGPIQFDNKAYLLNWSSQPVNNFYKQEYLVKNDIEGKYKTMLLIDVLTNQPDIKNVVATKIAELKKMKESNPVVNYESITNPSTGEYMLDFLLTANGADGNMAIAERNVYRYKVFTSKSGQKGVLLFGVSIRSYGAAITSFISGLKSTRKDLIAKVAQFKIPEIAL